MCSKYATQNRDYGSFDQANFFYNTAFTEIALRQRSSGSDEERIGPALSAVQSSAFLEYIYAGFLEPSRIQGKCGSCWAYSISAGVQYATALAYQRLGGFFNNRYMAPQLLLSCIEAEGVACGCYGGDLAAAMSLVSKEGMVTFRQFPYENDSSVVTQEGQLQYICRVNEGSEGYLGTCAPCRVDEPDLEEVVSDVSGPAKTSTAFLTLSSCMPCGSVGVPFYFPVSPCRLFREDESVDANVEALKRALRSHGPLCATIRVNREDIKRIGKSQLISNVLEAPVYRPDSTPPSGALHAVIIVAYVDPWAESKAQEDRSRAVFVCRNSWGQDWGFKMRTRQIAQEKDGAQKVVETILGGFFAVSMYESVEATGLLRTSITVTDMHVRTLGDDVGRPLRLTDPFVTPFNPGFLEAFRASHALFLAATPRETTPTTSSEKNKSSSRFSWRSILAICGVLLIVVIALIVVWG